MSKRKAIHGSPTLAVGYIRLSPRGHGEDDPKLGIDAQREAVEAWAQRGGVQVASWHVDDRVSGDVMPAEREGFLEAIASLEDVGAGVLVVSRRDRIGRDPIAVILIERAVEAAGAVVRSADGTSDAPGPEGVFMRRIIDAAAEYERALIRMRTLAALAVKRKRGEVLGTIPYGFQRANSGKKIEANVEEQRVVDAARSLRVQDKSLRQIAFELTEAGFRSRKGTPFTHVQVGHLLRLRDGLGRAIT